MAKSRVDNVLLLMIVLLVIIGLVLITSMGVTKSISLTNKAHILYPSCTDAGIDCYYLLKKHVEFVLAGIAALIVVAKIHYRFWKKIAVFSFALGVFLLCLVLVIGKDYGTDSRSWLSIGGFSFQPIEFAKLSLVFFLAYWLERKGGQIASFQQGFLPFCIVTCIIILPLLFQPDLGGALVVIAIAVAMFYAAGGSGKYLTLSFLITATIGLLLVFSFSGSIPKFQKLQHRIESVITNIDTCHEDYCAQIKQAYIAVGSGGFWGKGLTQGVQKSYWLPQSSDDFIFAASAEELGFIGIFLLVVVYAVIAYRGFKIASGTQNRFAMLTAVGITIWITAQAFMHIGVNLGLMPVTGLTLPFISYGGSSLLSIMIACGILLHISKNTSDYAPSTKRRGNRRPHYSKYSSYKGA